MTSAQEGQLLDSFNAPKGWHVAAAVIDDFLVAVLRTLEV